MTWRMVFAMVGVLVGAGGCGTPYRGVGGGGRHGCAVMGIVVSIGCGTAMLGVPCRVNAASLGSLIPSRCWDAFTIRFKSYPPINLTILMRCTFGRSN